MVDKPEEVAGGQKCKTKQQKAIKLVCYCAKRRRESINEKKLQTSGVTLYLVVKCDPCCAKNNNNKKKNTLVKLIEAWHSERERERESVCVCSCTATY